MSLETIPDAIRMLQDLQVHFVKIRDFLSADEFYAIADAANKAGLKLALQNRKYPEVFFSQELQQGTAVLVGMNANMRVKHAVPPLEGSPGISGSIVGRCITREVPWDLVDKEVAKRS